jgi:hypothetical protein
VVCELPYGRYKITDTLKIPPNVLICFKGHLFNFLSDPFKPIIHGSRRSHCSLVRVHANARNGVIWGDYASGSAPCDSMLGYIWVYHVGVNYDPNLQPYQQQCGLRLHGLNFALDRFEVKGGNIGLDLYGASDLLCPSVFLIGCATGLRLESAEQIILPSVVLDTNINTGIQIDNSNDVWIHSNAFVNSDNYGSAMEVGVLIGRYSGPSNNHNINIDYTAQSTGGYGLEVSNTEDCKINLTLTNSRTFSQRSGNGTATSHWMPLNTDPNKGALKAHNIGINYHPYGNEGVSAAAIKYGPNCTGYLKIDLTKSANIASYEGQPYGKLIE